MYQLTNMLLVCCFLNTNIYTVCTIHIKTIAETSNQLELMTKDIFITIFLNWSFVLLTWLPLSIGWELLYCCSCFCSFDINIFLTYTFALIIFVVAFSARNEKKGPLATHFHTTSFPYYILTFLLFFRWLKLPLNCIQGNKRQINHWQKWRESSSFLETAGAMSWSHHRPGVFPLGQLVQYPQQVDARE